VDRSGRAAGPGIERPERRPAARAGVLRRLIHTDPVERERALRQSRRRGWLEAGDLLVTALAAADGRPAAALGRLATALQADSRGATWAIGAHEGCAILVTSAARAAIGGWDLGGRLSSHDAAEGVVTAAAVVHDDEDDILPAVAEAVRSATEGRWWEAARIATGGLPPIAMLLATIDAPAALLRRASPGAFALWHGGDETLLRTVEAYLDAGARVSVACRRLHIHRTTLYYRLENLPAAVRDELADGWRRSVMHLVLKLLRLRALDR
jgi:hypothetical protein